MSRALGWQSQSRESEAAAEGESAAPDLRRLVAMRMRHAQRRERAREPQRAFDQATRGQGGEVPYRAEMERAFGEDFSTVKAHSGQAGAMGAMGARAAAHGEQVAFAGEPDRKLVAHELTHVVQSRRAGGGGVAASSTASPADASEEEADALSEKVAGGERVAVSAPPSAGLQLQIEAKDLAGAKLPDEKVVERVVGVLRGYPEKQVRQNLDDICGALTSVPDWNAYADKDLRALIELFVDGGGGGGGQPAPLEVRPGRMNNPWLWINVGGVGAEMIIDDSSDAVDGWAPISQTCSVMAPFWLAKPRAGKFNIRSLGAEQQLEAANALRGNLDPESQLEWARGRLGGKSVELAQLDAQPVGTKFLLYTRIHVTAAVKTSSGFLYYDPETGSAEEKSWRELEFMFDGVGVKCFAL